MIQFRLLVVELTSEEVCAAMLDWIPNNAVSVFTNANLTVTSFGFIDSAKHHTYSKQKREQGRVGCKIIR